MSEWISFLAVFWALWAADGIRLSPAALFGLIGGRRRAKLSHGRVHRPSWSPAGWRTTVADIPFALAPAGITNRPAGATGRPTELPAVTRAWAWAEIREASVVEGWLLVNGTRFCRDTGHLRPGELLALARLDGPARLHRIGFHLQRWLRPTHLQRRLKVLRGRTATVAMLNALFLFLAGAVTIFLAGNVAERLPARWSALLAGMLPLLLVYLAVLHVAAVFLAWRAIRRLKGIGADKRGLNLLSATLLPPQALRLRALAGEFFFPPQHPLAYALAFARKGDLRELSFHGLGDLRWPVGAGGDSPLTQEITRWFRAELSGRLKPLLQKAGLNESALFAAPVANSRDSASYCPRCRSQFVAGPKHCPHGIELQPVARR